MFLFSKLFKKRTNVSFFLFLQVSASLKGFFRRYVGFFGGGLSKLTLGNVLTFLFSYFCRYRLLWKGSFDGMLVSLGWAFEENVLTFLFSYFLQVFLLRKRSFDVCWFLWVEFVISFEKHFINASLFFLQVLGFDFGLTILG